MAITDLTQEEQELLGITDEYVEVKSEMEKNLKRIDRYRAVYEWAKEIIGEKKVEKIRREVIREMNDGK